MKYFTTNELLNRRLVSKVWNKCAIIRYRRTVPMTLTTSEQDMRVINDTYKSSELGSVVTALKINTRLNKSIETMMTRIGAYITDFEVEMTKPKKGTSSTINFVSLQNLKNILEKLPNITRLTIRNLPKSLPEINFVPSSTISKLVYIGLDQPSNEQPQYTKPFLEQLFRGPNVTTVGILSTDSSWNNGVRPILQILHHYPKSRIAGLMYSIDFEGSIRSSDLYLLEKFNLVSMIVGTCKLDSNVLNTALARMYDSLVHFTMDVLIGGDDIPLIFPEMEDLIILNILCTRRVVINDAPSGSKLFPKLIEMAGNEYLFQKLFMNGPVYYKIRTCKLSFCAQVENKMTVLNIATVFPNLTRLIVDADCSWCGIKSIVTELPRLNKLVYTFGKDIQFRQWVKKQGLTEVLSFHGKGRYFT